MKAKIILNCFILCVIIVNGDTADKVDPKLDLQESKELTTSGVNSDKPTVIINSSTTNTKTSSPKIHGLRVTVDTTGVKKSKEEESNESTEIVDKKNSRKIGIHTDITFEITGDGIDKDNSNGTSVDSDEDASVPIFKGRDRSKTTPTTTTATRKPKKPYDPRDQLPSNHWPITGPTSSNYPIDNGRFYPYNPPPRIQPSIYTRSRNNNNDDSNIYRSIDNWSNFVPITRIWTTERTYYPSISRPQTNYDDLITNYHVHHYKTLPNYHQIQRSPCFCILDSSNTGWKNKRSNNNNNNYENRIKSTKNEINNKLDSPFSKRK